MPIYSAYINVIPLNEFKRKLVEVRNLFIKKIFKWLTTIKEYEIDKCEKQLNITPCLKRM